MERQTGGRRRKTESKKKRGIDRETEGETVGDRE